MKFLLERAGPKYLSVLSKMINSQDEMGLTPIYLLCRQGYSKKEKKNKILIAEGKSPMEHKDRIEILKLLVSGMDSQYSGAKVPLEDKAEWLLQVKEVKYSPLHWLAYWNDTESILFLLRLANKDEKITIDRILCLNCNDNTPVDTAGKNRSNLAAMLFLDFFL